MANSTGFNACEASPSKEHDFADYNEDNRCTWCDAKPWYRSVQADYVPGTPVDPFESGLAALLFSATVALTEDRDLYARPA